MVLEIMGRHDGWAVIVALVGGGQEIHGGEAGLAAWGDAIAKHPEWEVTTSPEAVMGGPAVAGSQLFREDRMCAERVDQEPALHLAISKRSYETDVTAQWVNAVLDGRPEEAAALATEGLPVRLTRDIQVARSGSANAKGLRRAGLIASSGAARLRADGVEPPTFQFLRGIDYVRWFLEPIGDHGSQINWKLHSVSLRCRGSKSMLRVFYRVGTLCSGRASGHKTASRKKVVRGKWAR